MFHLIAALALGMQAAAVPVPTSPNTASSIDQRMMSQLQAAAQAVKSGRPQVALDTLTPVIAAYEADLAGETRRIYCGMSTQETLLYLTMATKEKVPAVALPPGYCTALYLKGYALVDLGRVAGAKAIYQRLMTLAPMYAQYQTEYGQLIRLEKDWPQMLAACAKAADAARIADPALRAFQERAALRCQGYALIDLQRWDEAAKRYRQALEIDATDAKAKDKLRYIAEQRGNARVADKAS